nr:hypothetical protein [Tanacetum cinerariifolium]
CGAGGPPYNGPVGNGGAGGGTHEGSFGWGGASYTGSLGGGVGGFFGGGGDSYTGSTGGDLGDGGGGYPYNGRVGAGWQGYSQCMGKVVTLDRVNVKLKSSSRIKLSEFDLSRYSDITSSE